MQVRLERPADISAAVSLREEEQGFWSKNASSMLQVCLRPQHQVPHLCWVSCVQFLICTASDEQAGHNSCIWASAYLIFADPCSIWAHVALEGKTIDQGAAGSPSLWSVVHVGTLNGDADL